MGLKERLRLDVSLEKTRVVNTKRKYSEFLGFKIKVHKKGQKLVVKSHISDKQLKRKREKLVEQARKIVKPGTGRTEQDEVKLYNAMVLGMQNSYRIATEINIDCAALNRAVMTVLNNRLRKGKKGRLRKKGRRLTPVERKRYGKTKMLRFVAGTGEPIYPIGYVQHKKPMNKKRQINSYTVEGRECIHTNLRVNVSLMLKLMKQPLYGRSAEYADNRISLFSAQWGKCAVTGEEFRTTEEIHCHHKKPRAKGGTDEYSNLILVTDQVHKLIHAVTPETIAYYMGVCQLNKGQMAKLNKLHLMVGNAAIATIGETTNRTVLMGRLIRHEEVN